MRLTKGIEKMSEGQPSAEMPKYKCHKEVHALKIQGVAASGTQSEPGSGIKYNGDLHLIPDDKRYDKIVVSESFGNKHQPVAGCYYVVYRDGYASFSPAEAFESGYTLIE